MSFRVVQQNYHIMQNGGGGKFGKSIILEFGKENIGEFKLLTFS